MTRLYTSAILGLTLFISSCTYFMKEPEKHEDFMSHCDCLVYKNEVETEKFDFGRVQFIDISKANGCVKEQLNNVYLLYYDTIVVAVYNRHPKENIKTIESFIKGYQTDTTNLSDFVKFDNGIRITVSRLCKDKFDNYYFGKYVDWREIEFDRIENKLVQTKDALITNWYKWRE